MTDRTPPEDHSEETLREEIEDDFDERQKLAEGGRQELRERLQQHNSQSPELSAGDVDADWDKSLEGSEALGGHVATPDQDQVDEIGAAAGLTYADDEPLNYGKVAQRDEKRWELNPASADEQAETDKTLDDDENYDLGYPQVVDDALDVLAGDEEGE
jgi:hypothetical protein